MDNKILADIIREKYYEVKMSAEYKLQLIKIVEMEDKFVQDFSKDKWKEYFYLEQKKGQLHSLEVDQIIEFVIKFLIKDYIFFYCVPYKAFDNYQCLFCHPHTMG